MYRRSNLRAPRRRRGASFDWLPRRRFGIAALPERARLFLPGRSLRFQLVGAGVALAFALSAQSFAAAREGGTTYRIQPGETLGGIAAATGVSLEKLVSLNGLRNPDLIVAGQELSLIGTADGPPKAAGAYQVKPGDTLWQIANTAGVSLNELITLNDVSDPDRLVVGQQLKLPTGTTLTAASASAARPAAAKPAAQVATQTAAAVPGPSALQKRVTAEARRIGGANVRYGVVAKNLVTGDRISVNGGDEFPSASVMKLAILFELERQTVTGALPWTESLRAQANAMITVSDNNAADQIANLVGRKAVNDTMARIGLNGTHFRNEFSDSRSAANPGQNDTTPSDMVKLLEMIATDQVLTPQATADMRGMLARNSDKSKLQRLLPGDARVAHKSGWYEGVANDVGIVTVDRTGARWIIAVFAQNVPDAETGNQLVAAVSRAVYDTWAVADSG